MARSALRALFVINLAVDLGTIKYGSGLVIQGDPVRSCAQRTLRAICLYIGALRAMLPKIDSRARSARYNPRTPQI